MTSQNSQTTFWQETELPLMSSRAASRAKTFPQQENGPGLVKELEAAFGPKSSDLLASYDRATSSWRTLQTCLVALVRNEADGLAEYSETWPSAGIMQNGKTYQRQPWALPIAENASGLLPTPSKGCARAAGYPISTMCRSFLIGKGQVRSIHYFAAAGADLSTIATAYEMMQGFPRNWTELQPSEMPSSRKSPK